MAETLLKEFRDSGRKNKMDATPLFELRRANPKRVKTSQPKTGQSLPNCKRDIQTSETKHSTTSKSQEYKSKTLSEELEIKDKTIKKLTREFKITLHNLLCMSDGVLDCWDAIDDAKRKGSVQHIMDARDQLMLLFYNLSDLAEFRGGKFELKRQDVDIKALIVGVINDFKSLSGSISLHIVGGTNTQLYCDENRIKQVVRNLITNAIRYAGADRPIQISISQDTKLLKIAVADEGRGVATNLTEAIFNHHSKNQDSKNRPGGADMGLMVCKEIILSHKGRMWVEAHENGGAIFCFTLPY